MNKMLTECYVYINKFINFNQNLNTTPKKW